MPSETGRKTMKILMLSCAIALIGTLCQIAVGGVPAIMMSV
jgi:hypothetical protein